MQRSLFAAVLACALLWAGVAGAQTGLQVQQLPTAGPTSGNDVYWCGQESNDTWTTYSCTASQYLTWLETQNLTLTGTVTLPSATTVGGYEVVQGPSSATVGDVATFANLNGKIVGDGGVALSSLATEGWTGSNYLSNAGAGTINLSGSAAPPAATGTVLDLVQSSGTTSRVQSTAYAASGAFTGARYDGTPGSPAAVQSGETIGTIDAYPYNGSALVGSVASLRFYAAENIASGHQGSQACVATTPIGSTTLANSLCQGNDGGVTVGSATDEGAGTIDGALYENGTALGSMATQAASSVAITGGSIAGVFPATGLRILGSSTGYTTLESANASSTDYVLTAPAATDTLVTLAATQTLTGKSIAGSEINSGTIPSAQLPLATTSAVGGVTVGSGLSVSGGVVSCPAATTSALGCMEVGSGLSVSGGVVSSSGCTAASTQGSTSGYAPTAPASTSAYEAQGLGAHLSITPACTGTVLFVVSGTIDVSAATAGLGVVYELYYGSGTAPANGGSLSGSPLCSPAQTYTNPTTVTSADVNVPFSIQCVVSGLTVGTAYWADLGAKALTTASDASFTNVNVSAVEN